MFEVRLVALVSGNPRKAWRGGTDPDDVWQEQTHSFESIEQAVDFVRGLNIDATTHVVIVGSDGEGEYIAYDQDRGGAYDTISDHLDAVTGDRPPPEEPAVVPVTLEDAAIPTGPPVMEAQ